jgi:hypothetical protein
MDREALVAELVRAHRVHTVILYGSRARGDATVDSDIDVACFADVATTTRDARHWNGLYLDAFVYPTELMASASTTELAKLCGGIAFLDERGLAAQLLERVAQLDRAPVVPLAADEQQMRRVWAHKMLARIQRDASVEAHYRRHWLLFQVLEDHFALRGEGYRGPKLALAELERRAPATFALFAAALAPDATIDAIAALVEHVAPLA